MTTRRKSAKTSATAARRRPVRRGGKKAVKQWGLAHWRHSFKLLPHRHTNYPTIAFILLLVGIFCGGWTLFASGDSYSLNAVVPAQPLTQPAVITAPHDGTTEQTALITVDGSCPLSSYVKLFRNNVFSGVGLCQTDGSFHIQTSLESGPNQLQAQDYNVTDQAGPTASGIVVTYQAPASPSSSGGSSTTSTSSHSSTMHTTATSPLVLTSDYTFKGYAVGQLSDWLLTISGGTAPYAVSVDWGDSSSDLSSQADAGQFDLQHTYQQPGTDQGSYKIIVLATDATGQKSELQLMTIVTAGQASASASGLIQGGGTGAAAAGTASGSTASTNTAYRTFWRVAGPTYAVSAVAAGSFWLGSRREVELLHHAAKHLPRRPRHA